MIVVYVFFCPRCDRKYTSETSAQEVEDQVKTHVAGQHPNHDPNWFETYPDGPVTEETT